MSYIGFVIGSPSLLSVVIISMIFIVGLALFFSGKFGSNPPSKNPFANDCALPAKPVVIDQSARDKVLKQGFTANKVPENLDAIIVGSGIGGMTLGATMAKAGKKVLVVEQHDQSGGCCHSFVEKGFEFDVGIHYCGEMGDGTLTRTILDQLTRGQLVWEQIDETYDMIAIGQGDKKKLYEMKSGSRKIFRDNLVRQFPDEEKAIDKYMALLKKCKGQFTRAALLKMLPQWIGKILVSTGIIHLITGQFQASKRTLDEVVQEITSNKDLQTVFSYCFGDFGTPPDQCPFFIQAALMNHFIYGGFYPRGGASEIAFHLIPTIEAAGGRCLVRAPVSEIVLKDGKATGVVVRKGSSATTINAPMVISGAGIYNTAKMLAPPATKPSVTNLVKNKEGLRPGYSGFSVFIGLNGSSKDLNLPRRQTWSFTSNELSKTFASFLKQSLQETLDGEVPLVFVSFPSAKDSSWEQRYPGKSVCTLVTIVNWDWFKDWENERVMHRGEGYENIKDAIAKKAWQQVLTLYPQLEDKVEYFQAGSPLSNNYYLAATKGEMYGLDHNMERFTAESYLKLHPKTHIPNLYLTGQDIMTCGFSGGLFAGLMTACHTLNRNVMFDAVRLNRKFKKQKKTN